MLLVEAQNEKELEKLDFRIGRQVVTFQPLKRLQESSSKISKFR